MEESVRIERLIHLIIIIIIIIWFLWDFLKKVHIIFNELAQFL